MSTDSTHQSVSIVQSLGETTPAWVSRDQLERQLAIIHSRVPDPIVGLFGPDSMMWRIGRCILPSLLGAGRALLLQVAHPWVTQGVDHHSATRQDPLGRAQRTFIIVLSMTFGSVEQAFAASRSLHARHSRVQGEMQYPAGEFAQGSRYSANEVNALMWVHATLWETSMRMYELVVEPVSNADKERYYQETKLFAYLFGIPEHALPRTWAEFLAYNESMWVGNQLSVTPAARNLTHSLLNPITPGLGPLTRWMEMTMAATLPPRLAREFGLVPSEKTAQRFQRSVKRLRFLQRHLPARALYVPAYFEALARSNLRRSDLLTRVLTRITLGRWRLVS